MHELEAHFQFLQSRIALFYEPWMAVKAQRSKSDTRIIQQQVFTELVRHVQQIEKRRKLYPKAKIPRRVAEIIRKRS